MKLGILLALVFLAGPVAVVKRSAPADVTAPNAISNLATSSPTSNACTLTFSAPYDDAPSSGGAVAAYTCRACTNGVCGATMDESEFTAATSITNEPTPAAPTTGESFAATISGGLVASTNYTFNCKSTDDASNTSALSNSATCTTGSFCSGGSFTICDEFTQTADPPTGWTEGAQNTSWATNGTQLRGATETTGSGAVIFHNTSTATSDQYAIVQLAVNDYETGLIMRSTTSTGNSDVIRYQVVSSVQPDCPSPPCNKIGWIDAGSIGESQGTIARCPKTMASGDYLMATITGTGTTRVVSVWGTSTMPSSPPTTGADCVFTGGTGCTGSGCYCVKNLCTPDTPTNSVSNVRVGVWSGDITIRRTYDNFAAGTP